MRYFFLSFILILFSDILFAQSEQILWLKIAEIDTLCYDYSPKLVKNGNESELPDSLLTALVLQEELERLDSTTETHPIFSVPDLLFFDKDSLLFFKHQIKVSYYSDESRILKKVFSKKEHNNQFLAYNDSLLIMPVENTSLLFLYAKITISPSNSNFVTFLERQDSKVIFQTNYYAIINPFPKIFFWLFPLKNNVLLVRAELEPWESEFRMVLIELCNQQFSNQTISKIIKSYENAVFFVNFHQKMYLFKQ